MRQKFYGNIKLAPGDKLRNFAVKIPDSSEVYIAFEPANNVHETTFEIAYTKDDKNPGTQGIDTSSLAVRVYSLCVMSISPICLGVRSHVPSSHL